MRSSKARRAAGGTSGACYDDQKEIEWTDIGQEPELTTVTKKVRRLFTFSHQQMKDAMWECAPNKLFLNFVNYDTNLGEKLAYEYDATWIGMGPTYDDVYTAAGHFGG